MYIIYIRTHLALNSMVLYTSCAHFMQVVRPRKEMLQMPLKYRLALILIPDPIPLVLQSFQGFYSLLHIVHCTQSRDYSIGMVESHAAYGNGIHVSLQRSNTEITWLIAVCIVLSTLTLVILPWTLGYGMNWQLALLLRTYAVEGQPTRSVCGWVYSVAMARKSHTVRLPTTHWRHAVHATDVHTAQGPPHLPSCSSYLSMSVPMR